MDNKIETISNLFEEKEIRSIWDSEKEEYFFSVVDVISALTESKNPNDYWYGLKIRMTEEEKSELSTKCRQLKMKATDGKYRETDTLDTYAILTNEIYKGWSGMKASEYKKFKGIRKESLRDNMTDIEVALTNIGEIATRDIAREEHPQGLKENLKVAKRGGGVAKGAKDLYEKETKKSAISKSNSLNYKYIEEVKQIENKDVK